MSSSDAAGSRFRFAVGERIGVYEILSPLGAGGMGEVYRARDTRLGCEVAVKLIQVKRAQNPTARDRIDREARIVASLNHPNILALHDIGIAKGAMYFVTELVDGASLRGLTPPLRKCLDIAAQIADGLSAAHAAGITHRDLKPDSVMVTRDGPGEAHQLRRRAQKSPAVRP
jgi:serine/threonine protein kinase